MRISKESWIIACIGIGDLIATIFFIERHGAREANPLFHLLWNAGPIAFVGAKLLCLAGPIAILEWARRHNPAFVLSASRMVIVTYLACYGVGVASLNSPAARAAALRRSGAFSYWEPYITRGGRIEFAAVTMQRSHAPDPAGHSLSR